MVYYNDIKTTKYFKQNKIIERKHNIRDSEYLLIRLGQNYILLCSMVREVHIRSLFKYIINLLFILNYNIVYSAATYTCHKQAL